MNRSVSTELELEAGCYTVRIRITATRYQKRPTVEEVLRMNCKDRQEKLLQIGMSYDLAHAKGIIQETEEDKTRKAEKEARGEAAAKAKAREEAKKRKYKDWLRNKKRIERIRRERERRDTHKKKRQGPKDGKPQSMENSDAKPEVGVENGLATDKDDSAPVKDKKILGEQMMSDREMKKAESETGVEDFAAPKDTTPFSSESLKVESAGAPASSVMSSEDIPASGDVPINGRLETTEKLGSLGSKELQIEPSQEKPFQKIPPASDTSPSQDKTAQDITESSSGDLTPKESPLPAVRVNGEEMDNQVLPTPPPSPSSVGPRSDVSEAETIVTYVSSIDTDLDNRYFEDEFGDDEFRNGSLVIAEGGPIGDDDNDLEEYSSDPWNAVCVVGLRLYTKVGEASVKVIRPSEDDEKQEKEETPLDVDDPMRSMSDEPVTPSTPLREKKSAAPESIAERLARQIPVPRSVLERRTKVTG